MDSHPPQRALSNGNAAIPLVVHIEPTTDTSEIDDSAASDSTVVEGDRSLQPRSIHEDSSGPQSETTDSENENQMFELQCRFLRGIAGNGQTPAANNHAVPTTAQPQQPSPGTGVYTPEDNDSTKTSHYMLCGINASNRTNQLVAVILLLLVAIAVTLLFATGLLGSNSTSRAGSDVMDVTTSRPFIQPPSLVPSQMPSSITPTFSEPSSVSRTTPSISNAPSIYVAQWVRVGSDIVGEAERDQFGISVALSRNGTILAVGAWFNDGNGIDSGHARVYTFDGVDWVQRGDDIDGDAASDQFGNDVELSADGNVLAVGGLNHNGPNGYGSGVVKVFGWNSSSWIAFGSPLVGEAAGDWFGSSIAISGDGMVVAAGAPLNDGNGPSAGQVRVFAWNGTDWLQRGRDLDGESSGNSRGFVGLSLDGSVVACGAPFSSSNGSSSGDVNVFQWTRGNWTQLGTTISGDNANDWFGTTVSLSGDGTVLAAGASAGNYFRTFRYDGVDWVHLGQTIRGTAIGSFGMSVGLSFHGDTMVIGGLLENSNGARSRHARIYRLSSSSQLWVRDWQALVGADFSSFWLSSAISDDGSTFAIAGSVIDGDSAGLARVYRAVQS